MSIKHILEGRPLGHPLHTLMTHIPLGMWLMALVFDIVGVASRDGHWAVEAAFACLFFGTVIGILSVIPGFTDWLDMRADRPGQKKALWHMALVLPALFLSIFNTILHYGYLFRTVPPYVGLGLSIAVNLLALAGGYLGGRMIYDDGVGVGRHRRTTELPQHTIFEPEDGVSQHDLEPTSGLPNDYHPVVPETALAENATLRVDIHGVAMTLVRAEGVIYAVQDFCTHRCGPLSEGAVCGKEIQCPWHRSVFDLQTGKPTHGPAKVDLKTYEVRVQDAIIHVRLDRPGRVFIVPVRAGGERRNPAEQVPLTREQEREAAARRAPTDLH